MAQTLLSNALNNNNRSLATRATDISNAKAVAAFSLDGQFVSQNSTGLGGGAKYIVRNDFITKGQFVQTGNDSDLSIGGAGTTGLFAVKLANGEIAYTGNGSVRQGENGQFYLADGSAILGWTFDAKGKLPTNTSTTSSLTPLSLQGVTSKATPTTTLGLVMNLSASKAALQGAGGDINFTENSVVSVGSINDIIVPGDTTLGALHLGDQFSLQATPPGGSAAVFEYGGIALTTAISATNTMYGQTTPGTQFAVAAVGVAAIAGQLAYNQTLNITVGGGLTYSFVASNTLGGGQNQFNSLNSLATAIQQSANGQLRARVGADNRLYIAASDASQTLTFAEQYLNGPASTSIIATLGLDNVIAPAAGVTRFASAQELQQKIGGVNLGLTATIAGVGLDFSAASALSSLQLGGAAQNIRRVQRATATPTLPTVALSAGQTWNAARTIAIGANNHFLNKGDFVRLSGTQLLNIGGGAIANSLVNGIYQVIDVSADQFYIATGADLGAPAVGVDLFQGAPPANMTWQKVNGNEKLPAPNANTAVGAGQLTATFTFGANALTQYNFQVGDVVSVTGSAAINAGFYRVAVYNAGAGTIQLTTTPSDAIIGAAANIADAAAVLYKVAGAGAVPNSVDTLPIQTIAYNVNTAPCNVKVFVNDTDAAKYKSGDVIALRNIANAAIGTAASVIIDNILLTNNKYYTIAKVDTTTPGQMFITFQADPAANPAVNPVGNARLGFTNNTIAAAQNVLVPAAGNNPCLGTNFYVDYIGREYSAMGVGIGASEQSISAAAMNTALVPTYASGNVNQNFSGGTVTENVITQSVGVVDSLGIEHTVNIAFGRTANNTWAVEVYLPKNANNTYDGSIANPVVPGQLAAGTIQFINGNGQLTSVSANLLNPISVTWSNGAASAPITINWGAINGLGPNGQPIPIGMSQIAGDTSLTSINNNGIVPGNLSGFNFDQSGIFYATFDNGTTLAVGQLAVASFQNFNGMTQKGGYLYESSESGAVLLKQAGVGGAGVINIGGVTSSAVDETGEFMGVIEDSQNQMLTTQVSSKINAANEFLVRNLS